MSGSQLQLELPPRPGQDFVVLCPECGPVARIEVEDHDWSAAEKWAYLAHRAHQRALHEAELEHQGVVERARPRAATTERSDP